MNLKKCRQILNAIALLVVIIVFASNIPLFNSIHKEMIYVSIFLHIPQELRIRSRGTERHSASN